MPYTAHGLDSRAPQAPGARSRWAEPKGRAAPARLRACSGPCATNPRQTSVDDDLSTSGAFNLHRGGPAEMPREKGGDMSQVVQSGPGLAGQVAQVDGPSDGDRA